MEALIKLKNNNYFVAVFYLLCCMEQSNVQENGVKEKTAKYCNMNGIAQKSHH